MNPPDSPRSKQDPAEAKPTDRRVKICGECRKPFAQNFVRHFEQCHKGKALTEWIAGEDGKGI